MRLEYSTCAGAWQPRAGLRLLRMGAPTEVVLVGRRPEEVEHVIVNSGSISFHKRKKSMPSILLTRTLRSYMISLRLNNS